MIQNEKGFTLIELMVVVLIIGILVAIAIPVFSSTADKARLGACEANLRTIDGAIAQYQAEYSSDPADPTALVTAQFLRTEPTCPHTDTTDYTIAANRGVCTQGHTIP